MDGTFPSPAVKEKRRLQSRLKAQVKVLGRNGVPVCVCVCVCVCVLGGVTDFNAWSEAGIIDLNTK